MEQQELYAGRFFANSIRSISCNLFLITVATRLLVTGQLSFSANKFVTSITFSNLRDLILGG